MLPPAEYIVTDVASQVSRAGGRNASARELKPLPYLLLVASTEHPQYQTDAIIPRREGFASSYRTGIEQWVCDRFCQALGGQILNFLAQLCIIPRTATL